MSGSAQPEPRPDPPEEQPAAPDATPAVEVSEFMSESSPEVRAMWAPQVRVVPPSAGDAEPLPTLPTPLSSATPRVVPPPARDAAPAPVRAAIVSPPLTAPSPARPARRGIPWIALLVAIAAAVAVAAALVGRDRLAKPPVASPADAVTQGFATIVSRPTGAEVLVNGVSKGTTPLKLTLPAGTYDVELRNGASKRALSVTIDPATATREFVDLAPDGGLGSVDVTTDTPGARVTIDGVARGVTPVVVPDVEPGSHRVGVAVGDSTIYRTVTVTAGAVVSVVASAAPSGVSGGWIAIAAPIELQVIENGEVIGTSGAARIMLPSGHHDLRLTSEPYEFDTTVSTQVAPGRTVSIPVDVPNGTVSINASPWADVFLDGRSVGSTPIGNLSVPVGTHEIIWRHPQLGERRQSVRVGARTPVRVGMDLTKAP